jgi:hypothetical protein
VYFTPYGTRGKKKTTLEEGKMNCEKNKNTLQMVISKKKIYRGNAKLAYFAGSKSLLTLNFFMFCSF